MMNIRRVGALRGRIAEADLALFHGLAGTHTRVLDRWLPRLTRAADNSKLWIVIAALLWASGDNAARRGALRGVLSLGLTSALVNGPLKWLGRRARPDILIVPKERRIVRIPKTTSFPSGHSASAFAFATGVSIETGLAALPLYGLASAVALSRVYTGAHYPSDVLVGAFAGTAAARSSLRPWPAPLPPAPVARRERLPDGARPSQDGDGLAVAVNVASGSSIAGDPSEEIRAKFPAAVVEAVDVGNGDDLRRTLTRLAAEAKVLGICGGDGSVNTAAEVAVDTEKPLMVVPAGTLNHLATAIGIETAGDAVAAVTEGSVVKVDVASIDGRAFLNTASFGNYVELVDARERLEAKIGKWPAVLLASLRVLRRAEPVSVEVNGRPVQTWMAFIGNCRYHPDGFAPTQRARLDDGALDFRYVDGSRPWARLRLIAALLTGRLVPSPVYHQEVVDSLRIRSRDGEPLRLARDGETFEGSTDFEVKKLATLAVFAPNHDA